MQQATTDDSIAVIEHEFGRFMMNAERAKSRLNSRIDRMALIVLGTLAGRGPSRLTTIAECTGLDASTMSRQVADLEKAGLLKRTPDPDDRRASLLEATVEGQELMQRLSDGRRRRLERMLGEWSEKDIQTLGRMLRKLNETTEKYGEQNAREFEQELNHG